MNKELNNCIFYEINKRNPDIKLIKNISLFLFVFLILGCTSVPKVENVYSLDNKKYDVVIDRDYMKNPDEFRYAINSFVKEKGGTSYSIEKYGPNDFYITIPGEIPVEDLPQIRHFHAGRTVLATLLSILGLIFLSSI